jgi:hypothetical protein
MGCLELSGSLAYPAHLERNLHPQRYKFSREIP